VNPNLLIFVEGTDCYNGDCDWWGGNLEGVQNAPVQLNVANRVVYSAHDYGPNLFGQSWFNSGTSYASLVSVWTKYWAYISLNGIAPVWLGEFGTTNNNGDIQNAAPGSQGQWFQSLITFLQGAGDVSWTYWALDGEDSYALLDNNYDPMPANPLKQQLLAGIQSTSGGGDGTGPTAPLPPADLSASAVSSSQINLSWTASATSGATYNVYAGTTSNFLPSVAARVATALTATSFHQQGLTASTTYYYLVTAVAASLESAASNRASAPTAAGTSTGGSSCQVNYSVVNQWDTGSRRQFPSQTMGRRRLTVGL
jgi:endoglucanase